MRNEQTYKQSYKVNDSCKNIESTKASMWDRLRAEHQQKMEENRKMQTLTKDTPGRMMIKELLARRRWVRRRLHMAKVLRVPFTNTRIDEIITCAGCGVAVVTLIVLVVSAVALAHLTDTEFMLAENEWFHLSVVAVSIAWCVCMCYMIAMLKLKECMENFEVDPDEAVTV